MTGAAPDLTILVPCFQEGVRIDRFADAAEAWAAERPDLHLEVLFVDDGSTDATPDRLATAAARLPAGRVLTLATNVGKGAALQAGMAVARGATVLFLDADLAVDLTHVDAALRLRAEGADIVVGCRNVPGAEVRKRQGLVRRSLGRGYRRLTCWWLGLDVADVTCGFKAFRRDAGRQLFAASRAARWGFDAEILYLAQRAGLEIREMPVRWYDGEVSAVRLGRDVFSALRELATVRWRHRSGRTPLVSPSSTSSPTSTSSPSSTVPRPSRVPAGPLRDG